MKIELVVDGNAVSAVSSDDIDSTRVLGFTAEVHKQLHAVKLVSDAERLERSKHKYPEWAAAGCP
ncbi:hypothetical protein [Budvicia aquatica]|uniref:Uncharacterized protein n=1 Tax=Budvicia aquatica TaxID=82979 RepID=A0A2C6DP85_9GAMM|nr:hypothetical protein [Budvicia aquatica]PHI31027.1 hypothetical protein CRN84_17650 [Budvicia aquatica]VFS51193.1 Uncharacterised protein [Budvicia aquatica]